MTDKQIKRPAVLCILDGWGFREDAEDNAVTRANAPEFRHRWETSPHALLDASEEHVGLPKGQMGNSEVGHMNLGAGRVVYQDLPMIDRAIARGDLARNSVLLDIVSKLKANGGTCHLMGLASPGGVHSHQDHMVALARQVAEAGVPVLLHAFLDGRDVPPQSAARHIAKMRGDISPISGTRIASLCGRYYAMDRDKRWERVQKAYDLLTSGIGATFDDPVAAVESSYQAGIHDEFVLPVALGGYAGMKDGDGLIFANFRTDRAREILSALLDESFAGFERNKIIKFAAAAGMVEYSDALNALMPALFPPKSIAQTLGEVIASAGLKQLRIAETEKYPHVTFFFNGGREHPFEGEERILVPSPKVATYDMQPEMSALAVTDKVVEAVESGAFDMIVLNYANPDMVGHTGVMAATVKAVETIDGCLARLFAAVEKQGGFVLLTADHGNCERMTNPDTGGPHTAHTLERVPLLLINGPQEVKNLRDGKLADVAPTLLALMGLVAPEIMDGKVLLGRPE